MQKTPEILYAITSIKHKTGLIKPMRHLIPGSDKSLYYIPLAETIEDALLFTYPRMDEYDFRRVTLKAWGVAPLKKHRLIYPKTLHRDFKLPLALELNHFGIFQNIRMEHVSNFTIKKSHEENEKVFVEVDKDKLYAGIRYKLLPAS